MEASRLVDQIGLPLLVALIAWVLGTVGKQGWRVLRLGWRRARLAEAEKLQHAPEVLQAGLIRLPIDAFRFLAAMVMCTIWAVMAAVILQGDEPMSYYSRVVVMWTLAAVASFFSGRLSSLTGSVDHYWHILHARTTYEAKLRNRIRKLSAELGRP
jgi:hypothetical protein